MAHRIRSRPGIAVVMLLALLAGCRQGGGPVQEAVPVAAPAREGAAAEHFVVDGARSELHVLVYRGGAMARFGHNHVLSSTAVSGDLYLAEPLPGSRLRLQLPVDSLVVDDPVARAGEGADFAAPVPPDAREATRHNLLGPAVLDRDHFPQIELVSVAMAGTRKAPQLTMRVTIRGVSRELPLTAIVTEDAGRLLATGEFTIGQSDFRITPFSVALGALQVQDTLRIRFRIVAVRATGSG